jgi:hypothetical protein
LDLHNPGRFHCWIAPFSDGCDRDSNAPFVRGEHSNVHGLGLCHAPLWLCFGVVLHCLGSACLGMRREENEGFKVSTATLVSSLCGEQEFTLRIT